MLDTELMLSDKNVGTLKELSVPVSQGRSVAIVLQIIKEKDKKVLLIRQKLDAAGERQRRTAEAKDTAVKKKNWLSAMIKDKRSVLRDQQKR